MADAEAPMGSLINASSLPRWLLLIAVAMSFLAFMVGWFSVDTTVRIWQYDSSDETAGDGDPVGAGTAAPMKPVVDLEMKPVSIGYTIKPEQIRTVAEENDLAPSYDQHLGNTGTQMMGVLLLHVVSLASICGVLGVFMWQQRSAKRLGPSLYRLLALFAVFSLLTLAQLAFMVPRAANDDVDTFLHSYASVFESLGMPAVDDRLYEPNIKFWHTWICCPAPRSVFGSGNEQFLVEVTTVSRPSSGFWLSGFSLAITGAAIVLAQRNGLLEPVAAPTLPAPVYASRA